MFRLYHFVEAIGIFGSLAIFYVCVKIVFGG